MKSAASPAPAARLPRHRLGITLALCVVIFLAGGLAGYGVAVLMPPDFSTAPPANLQERRDRLAGQIDAAIGLSPEQLDATRNILETRLREVEVIRQQIRPQMGEQARQLNAQMQAILTPDQRVAWEQYFNERFGRFVREAPPEAPATQPAEADSPQTRCPRPGLWEAVDNLRAGMRQGPVFPWCGASLRV